MSVYPDQDQRGFHEQLEQMLLIVMMIEISAYITFTTVFKQSTHLVFFIVVNTQQMLLCLIRTSKKAAAEPAVERCCNSDHELHA